MAESLNQKWYMETYGAYILLINDIERHQSNKHHPSSVIKYNQLVFGWLPTARVCKDMIND